MFYLLIGVFAIYAMVKVVINDKKKGIHAKRKPHVDNTEEYIPQSVMQGALTCAKCGASVPLSADKKLVTMFCPFCGNPIEDAKKIIEQATQNKREDRDYELRLREMEMKLKEQENVKRQIRHDTFENITDTLTSMVPLIFILGLFYFLYKVAFGH